jgi:aspartyl-tRNA(Asn)/glutamyl-tRNA(Gln) amidotransferase subunit A
VGPLGGSVHCCAVLDAIMAADEVSPTERAGRSGVNGLELAVLEHYVTEGLDREVAATWEHALHALAAAGARLTSVTVPEIEALPRLNAGGGIAAAEAYRHHRGQLEAHGDRYDPRVARRIGAGAGLSDGELAEIRAVRAGLVARFERLMKDYAALLLPTVPIIAPPISALDADEEYVRLNLLLLRNPGLINFLDGCAISLPIHAAGSAPVGLMLAGRGGADAQLLAVAAAVERLFPR